VGKIVHRKWDDGGQSGMGGGDSAGLIVVVSTKMDVAVDGSWEDQFTRGVDVLVGGRQELIGADGDDLFTADGKAGLVCLRRGHHLPPAHDDIDFGGWHGFTSLFPRFSTLFEMPRPCR
jgi:hypothetical protein